MSDTGDPAAQSSPPPASVAPRPAAPAPGPPDPGPPDPGPPDPGAPAPARPAAQAEAATRGPAQARIGIRELRQHASVYVDLAERGYTVDITNRGRLVAQLIPVREPGSPLERMIAAGIMEPAEEGGGLAGIDPYPAPAPGAPAPGQPRRPGRPGRP